VQQDRKSFVGRMCITNRWEELAGPFASREDAEAYIAQPPEDLGEPGRMECDLDRRDGQFYVYRLASVHTSIV
jgi:hypothetical protein